MTKPADLIAYVFDGQPHLLSGTLLQWMEASPRFVAFVETYRDKIRKKIRIAREPESALDLRGELEVAHALLGDRRLAVAYEPYASARRRGPDFSVIYRTNLVFNVEVARIRVEENGAGVVDVTRKEERLVRVLLGKLGQMQPAMPNLLVVQAQIALARAIDLNRLMQAIKVRADQKDPSFYAAARYSNPAAFYKDFSHLSGILIWDKNPTEQSATQVWANKQARPALPDKVLHLVSMLLEGGDRAL